MRRRPWHLLAIGAGDCARTCIAAPSMVDRNVPGPQDGPQARIEPAASGARGVNVMSRCVSHAAGCAGASRPCPRQGRCSLGVSITVIEAPLRASVVKTGVCAGCALIGRLPIPCA